MSKKLVTYFSASGVTKAVAERLAQALNADIYEIKPQTPYTKADLDWTNKTSRSTVEMQNKSFRPPLADQNAPVAEYDTVFVGFPIWWYVAPTIINSFLESYNFSGKKVVLFATSGGSGFGKTVSELKGSIAPGATLIEGGLLNHNPTAEQLKAWAEKF